VSKVYFFATSGRAAGDGCSIKEAIMACKKHKYYEGKYFSVWLIPDRDKEPEYYLGDFSSCYQLLKNQSSTQVSGIPD